MDLLEHQGKRLLKKHGVSVPRGTLWAPGQRFQGPCVVKAQIPAGRRGKSGGILFVSEEDSLGEAVAGLRGTTIGGYRVDDVYVEERIAPLAEHYFSLSVNRDDGTVTLLASAEGGVDVEAQSGTDRLLRLRIDPLLGLRRHHVREVAKRFGKHASQRPDALTDLLHSLWSCFQHEDAILLEVNPLASTIGGDFIALDAKLVIDSNSLFRHDYKPDDSDRGHRSLTGELTSLGTSCTEIDRKGRIIAAVSGAGLMMATVDLLQDFGIGVRAAIDLGGAVLAEDTRTQRIFEAVFNVRPEILFVNAFLHTASCGRLAEALQDASPTWSRDHTRVIVRLKGHEGQAAGAALTALGMKAFSEFRAAMDFIRLARD